MIPEFLGFKPILLLFDNRYRGINTAKYLGIGKYKDTGKILPETLREVENMERLVGEILSISKMEMDGLTRREPVSLGSWCPR